MNTETQQFSRHVSVPSGEGIRVDKAVTIERPPAEVYAFWCRLENLPRFMRHLQSVTVRDDLHSHWATKIVGGKVLEWDAEIIEQRQNEMISWRSAPGADLNNAGSVWFTALPGGKGTLVRLELQYVPPAGKTGELLADVFGRDAQSEIEDDLVRLKALLETGRLPERAKYLAGWEQVNQTTRQALSTADTYIRDNPWAAIGCAALCGFALGFFCCGRSSGAEDEQSEDRWL